MWYLDRLLNAEYIKSEILKFVNIKISFSLSHILIRKKSISQVK